MNADEERRERRAYDTGQAIAHVWRAIDVIVASETLRIGDLAEIMEEAERSYATEAQDR